MTEQILRVLADGKPLAVVKKLLDIEHKRIDKSEFYTTQREEYDNTYKLKEIIQATIVFDEVLQKEVTTTEVVGFDYLDDAPTYEEYRDETKTVLIGTETLYDDNDAAYESEIFEEQEVRPYIAKKQSEIDALVNDYVIARAIDFRIVEYSKLNQDEMRFDDEVNGTTIWVDRIKDIKLKFPKA